ncbi:E3 SUMO-protein ligase pias1 [Homalodisca vitripennis]|nr:E3 SUMO-protein ligase pias1 [Homalodisca vitripennis]
MAGSKRNPIPTNRPGVEAKRPPRPVNISSLLRLSPTVANHVQVSWGAEYGRGYVIAINLVKKLTSQQLLQRLRTRGVRHADYTTGLIKEKLREDADSEIATTSLRVSLMCPLGKLRMTIPCRPTTCTHLQCFDANLYLQMNERKPTWTCPVCDKPGLFDKLVIDGYFQEVLSSGKLPPDGNEIQLHQDGTWSISASKKDEKADDAPAPVKNRGGPPAVTATVEIADDEVVPVVSDGEDKDKDKEKTSEAKAAAPKDVVDLTFSDDSDEEMAPATAKTNGPAKTGEGHHEADRSYCFKRSTNLQKQLIRSYWINLPPLLKLPKMAYRSLAIVGWSKSRCSAVSSCLSNILESRSSLGIPTL